MSPFVLLAAAGLGFALYKARTGTPATTAPLDRAKPVPLYAGVPYLFLVRLEKPEDEAREVLEGKGVESLLFTPSSNPPAYVTGGESWSTTTASFKAVPNGNSAGVSLGMPFYGVGRLEQLVRLDSRPFSEAPSA